MEYIGKVTLFHTPIVNPQVNNIVHKEEQASEQVLNKLNK